MNIRMPVSSRHIEVFQAVMRSGSVTAAAGALHTSQPTVSRELARLEQLLGFALFDRGGGRLRPTARALILFEEVQRAFVGLEQILARADRLARLGEGQLSIACLPALSHALLPGACRRFLSRHDGVGISITPLESPQLEEALTAQRYDLGLIEDALAPAATEARLLFSGEEVCVLPSGHPLCARPLLEPADFADQRFISLAPGDRYRRQVDEVFRAAQVERRMVLETQSAVSVCTLVQQGLGLAVINPLTAHSFAGQGLEVRRFAARIPFQVGLVLPEYRPSSPLADLFAQALGEEADAFDALTAWP
jgi:DNA-binding transcriptional LysR family regulator